MASTAVAKKPDSKTDVGKVSSAFLDMAGDVAGTGLENVTANDLLIPRLTILQALSPQLKRQKAEFMEGAKEGDIVDVGLAQNFGDKVTIIPVHYEKKWLQWAPRASGKGLQGIHDDDSIMAKTSKNEKNQPVLENGDLISETAQIYCMIVDANYRKAFIPMTSTQLKKARRLLTLATDERLQRPDGSEFTPPLFYRQYVLGTIPENNQEGDWIGWTVERGDPIDTLPNFENVMRQIKDFRESLTSGDIKADIASMAEEAGNGTVVDHDGAM